MDKGLKKKIVAAISNNFSDRFRVIDNTDKDRRIVFGTLPDVILMRPVPPDNDDIIFVMAIDDGDDLVGSLPRWRELSRVPASFYIVVPEDKLVEAKRLVSALAISAKFAFYQLDHNEKVRVKYE